MCLALCTHTRWAVTSTAVDARMHFVGYIKRTNIKLHLGPLMSTKCGALFRSFQWFNAYTRHSRVYPAVNDTIEWETKRNGEKKVRILDSKWEEEEVDRLFNKIFRYTPRPHINNDRFTPLTRCAPGPAIDAFHFLHALFSSISSTSRARILSLFLSLSSLITHIHRAHRVHISIHSHTLTPFVDHSGLKRKNEQFCP